MPSPVVFPGAPQVGHKNVAVDPTALAQPAALSSKSTAVHESSTNGVEAESDNHESSATTLFHAEVASVLEHAMAKPDLSQPEIVPVSEPLTAIT